MKKDVVLCMAALSIVLAAYGKADRPAGESASATSQSKVAVSAVHASEYRSAANPEHQERAQAPTHRQDAKQYLCQGGAGACRVRGPLVANSEAEAQWLLSHGYPTEAELARLEAMGLSQLKAETQAGNTLATVIYGRKTAIEGGRFFEGLGVLRDAAMSGNLYAYYGLSDVYGAETKQKNLVHSAAYLRLAYLLGDGKASAGMALQGLNGVERVAADERTASLYQTFAKNRRPSPRPLE
ncbi:hypothetical protein NRY95_02085 [Xanthomonas campestris pv. phormiicola]|nr:hypothetical protein [Xanthomonas campestris pv. phormiicola]UYC16796.1 hypothetical protein NRY95_02085 [Xanthomonas campestris pv. phormiicola]